MENNIFVRITGKSNMDEVNQTLEQSKQKVSALTQEMEKSINTDKKKYAELQKELKAEQQSIVVLQQNSKAANLLANSTDSARKRLADLRQVLVEMEDAGNTGKAYEQVALAAAQLTDQVGDLQQKIRVLSSDTVNLDAAMSVGSGITGAFNTATSAAALLGGESEKLQQAFTKVQAALSILNGVQSVANMLNKDSAAMVVLKATADGIAERAAERKAIAETTFTKASWKSSAATIKGTLATIGQTAATKAAAAGQWLWNAAMYANPIGLLVAAAAALAAGIYVLVSRYSSAGKAEHDYAEASKELEKIQKANAVSAAKRAYEREQQIRKNTNAENEALDAAKKRNASELEIAAIKASHAKKAANDTAKYANQEIELNNKEVAKLQEMRDAKRIQLNEASDGSRKYKKLQDELAEAEQKYHDAVKKGKDLEQERADARREAALAEQEVIRQREAMQRQAENTRIELMRDGATKEIALIDANYKEQLKSIQGNSEEEIALRKALEDKKAKEIANVRKKYALEERKTAIQEQKNLLQAMSSSGGTESDYQNELKLRKEILTAESQAKIDALDKDKMSDAQYAAEVKAIRLQLAADIKSIDDGDAQRHEQYMQSINDADVRSAKARVDALTGAEGVDGMTAIWADYYSARIAQIDDNEKIEIAALERSGLKGKEYEAKETEILQKAAEERNAIRKEEAQTDIDILEDASRELERALTNANDAVDKSQGLGKLSALQQRFDAENALYDAQEKIVKSKYEQGLIKKQDYEDQMLEISRNRNEAEADLEQQKIDTIVSSMQEALQKIQEVSNMVFEVIGSNIQAEMDALDNEYTTDAKEAAKNANKKYITEEEYAKKKAALELKQQKMAKAKALTDIAIATAMSIMQTLAQLGATPWGIAMAAIAGAMGAAQLAIASSKPLAQYEKGRKGGKGEYALVGEKGPELMYVPSGASIVPNNKLGDMNAWGAYGVPTLAVPQMPYVSDSTINMVAPQMGIDYQRLGEAVARNLPQQKQVSVSVDRTGIVVTEGANSRKFLNQKYLGAWS